VASHTWKVSDPITGNQSLLVDLRPHVEQQSVHQELVFRWTRQSVINTVPPVPAAPAQTLAIALPKKNCDCTTKQSMAAFFQNLPLNEIEKQAIAEVEAHRPIDWNPDASEQKSIVTGLCSMMARAQNYVGDNTPAPLVNALRIGNKLYTKATGESIPPIIPGIPYTAKQVYIGKVFFEEFLLKQKCNTSTLVNNPEFGDRYKEVDGKPLFYADVFNEKGSFNLLSRLDSVKYKGQSSEVTRINAYIENLSLTNEMKEFHKLLLDIFEEREPTDKVYQLARGYCKEFGFENCSG